MGKKAVIFPAEGTALTHYAALPGTGAGMEGGQFSLDHLVLVWGCRTPVSHPRQSLQYENSLDKEAVTAAVV